MKLLIVGSTGLVGRHVLELALAHPAIDAVTAPVRRACALAHAKLDAPVVDFDALPADAAWWRVDAVVCTLGTTIRAAGSEQAFRRVDHDYPLAVARHAHRHGARTFVLNSALGADRTSRIFYNRVKGELEHALAAIGFESLTLVRPGLIGGMRDEPRPAERLAVAAVGLFGAMLPRRWRVNPAANIARELVDAAVHPLPGSHIVAAERMA
jgi:uncharacterized protein YbjT (DUF2867 family)